MGGKHNKCCCGCLGCCFPFDPNFDYGGGVFGRRVFVLDWEIVAPNCPEIDGLTGSLAPETTGPHDNFGGCGNCLCMVNSNQDPVFISGQARFVVGEECSATPCGIDLCFNLTCDINAAPAPDGVNELCCSRTKLLVMVTGAETVTGGSDPEVDSECLDVIDDEYVNFGPCQGDVAGELLRQLDPVACTCEEGPAAEFRLVYDLSEIGIGCSGTVSGGPCDGEPLEECCIPVSCDLTDAELIVVVGEP